MPDNWGFNLAMYVQTFNCLVKCICSTNMGKQLFKKNKLYNNYFSKNSENCTKTKQIQ